MSTFSHHICVYNGCFNENRKTKNVSFFRFPVRDLKRTEEWKKNCGNVNIFDMDNCELKNRLLYQNHFLPADIYGTSRRKLLRKNAVPIKFCEQAEEDFAQPSCSGLQVEYRPTGKRRSSSTSTASDENTSCIQPKLLSYSSSSSSKLSERVLNMPSPREVLYKKKISVLTSKVSQLRKKLKVKNVQSCRLKKNKVTTSSVLHNLLVNKSQHVKTFINMQLCHTRGTQWSKDERQFALSLHYKSPTCYKYMLNVLKFKLPTIRTIQMWLKINNLRTGINKKLFKKIYQKAKCMNEEEKKCVVMFDEIRLKRKLEWNEHEDIIEGFQDLGTQEREPKLANSGLVVLIRGLLYNWKLPLCYYTSSGPVLGPELKNIIQTVIRQLLKLTFHPKIIVCDQGTTNRSAYTLLGASEKNPVIHIDNYKIYTCFDSPHLVKNLRNNFLNPKLKIFIDKKPVNWNDISQTYEIDRKSNSTRAMLKITEAHIAPTNFQKMRVKFATQIFSHTVAAAIRTAEKTEELRSATATNTADFIENINKIFDALNSNILNDPNPDKRPLSIYNNHVVDILTNALHYFMSIEVYEGDKLRNDIYCINGFIWTIKSILLLWEEIKETGTKYLLTRFINQDALENLFSVLRNRNGYNPTPTVRQCRIALQHNIYIRLLMDVESSNCEVDEADLLEVGGEEEADEGHPSVEDEMIKDIAEKTAVSPNDDNKENENISASFDTIKFSLESASNIYVAGYLVHKVLKRYNCEHCQSKLIKGTEELTNKIEFFTLCKDYGVQQNISFLRRPSEEFVKLFIFSLQLFSSFFEQFKCGENVAQKIKKELKVSLEAHFSWFFSDHCIDHAHFIVNLFIKMKMYRQLKWATDDMSEKTKGERIAAKEKKIANKAKKIAKPHRKVRILST